MGRGNGLREFWPPHNGPNDGVDQRGDLWGLPAGTPDLALCLVLGAFSPYHPALPDVCVTFPLILSLPR